MTWQEEGRAVAANMERKAIVDACRPAPLIVAPRYVVAAGELTCTAAYSFGSPVAVAWHLNGQPIERDKAAAMISERMERLGQ